MSLMRTKQMKSDILQSKIVDKMECQIESDQKKEIDELRKLTDAKAAELRMTMEKLSSLKSQVNNSCPLNRLHPNIEWEILKQLDFKDYRNLALTCRKWFNTASTAPQNIKPNLKVKVVKLKNPGIVVDDHEYFRCIPSLSLINKVVIESALEVHTTANLDFFRFFHENISRFEYDYIVVKTPVLCEKKCSVIYDLVKKTTKLKIENQIKSDPYRDGPIAYKPTGKPCVFDYESCLESTKSHTYISMQNVNDPSLVNIILMQLASYERPNLQTLEFELDEVDDVEQYFDEASEELDEFIEEINYDDISLDCEFNVPNLPHFDISMESHEFRLDRENKDSNGFPNVY